MPLVDIELIEGVFDDDQKQRMIRDVTEAMVGVEGEAMRGVTWVRVQEIASGEWAIGGKPMMLSAPMKKAVIVIGIVLPIPRMSLMSVLWAATM